MSQPLFENGCRRLEPRGIGQRDMQDAGARGGLQFPAGALGDLPAMVDDGDPGGELVGLLEILRGEQDRHAGLGEPADHPPDLLARRRVEPSGRLVEEEHVRGDDQRGGDVEPPPHAARIVLHLPGRRIAQAEGGEQLVGAGSRRPPAKAPEPGEQDEVLAARQILVERSELPGHGDGAADVVGSLLDVVAHDGGRSGVGPGERGKHSHQRGLARAVRAENRKDHAGAGRQDRCRRRRGRRRRP